MKLYKINEIFSSIHGEGAESGKAAIFIRFSGCNLSCTFCDTKHITHCNLQREELYTYLESRFESSIGHLIMTGGEPLLQLDYDLVKELNREYMYKIHIETNGTIPLPNNFIPHIHWLTVSPKLGKEDLKIKAGDELKLLYNPNMTEEDYDYYEDLPFRYHYIQPITDKTGKINNLPKILEFLKRRPEWKLSIQIHKLLNIK